MKSSRVPFFAKKLIGVTLILGSVLIFVYLGWFYFFMPKLVVNQKSSLESAFDRENYLSLFEHFNPDGSTRRQPNGVIIGGVLYPNEYTVDIDEPKTAVPVLTQTSPQDVRLTISELDIADATVELNVDGTDADIYHSVLRRAVAHFANTAYPGQKGNFFLFGHSKLPLLAGSDYESIFTNLPRIKNGALVEVTASGVTYRYRINYTAVLSPKDVFILNQPREERLLTLMTCIPPGFGSNRYVAVGNLVGAEEKVSVVSLKSND